MRIFEVGAWGKVVHGESLEILRQLPDNVIDALVTDPPGGGEFMNRAWDSDRGGREQWVEWLTEIMREVYRVLKPGAYGFVWAFPRTSDWTGWALESAGFIKRELFLHLHGQGFPKNRNVALDIDKKVGAESAVVGEKPWKNQDIRSGRLVGGGEHEQRVEKEPTSPEGQRWKGFGTATKPAVECWWLVQKPFQGSFADNLLQWEVGALNLGACEVQRASDDVPGWHQSGAGKFSDIPVVSLLSDLSPDVEQSIRGHFNGFDSVSGVWRCLPVQTVPHQKRSEKVLQQSVQGQEPFSDSRGGTLALRSEAYARDSGESIGRFEDASLPQEGEPPQMGRRHCISHEGLSNAFHRVPRGRGPITGSADATKTEIHSGAQIGDGPDVGTPFDQGGSSSSQERQQTGQPAGKSGVDDEQFSCKGSAQCFSRDCNIEGGEHGTESRSGSFEVLARDVPEQWATYFEPTGRFVKVAESNGFLGTDTFKIKAQSPEEIRARCGKKGRHAPNLLLSHSEHCVLVGTQHVKGCPATVIQGGKDGGGFDVNSGDGTRRGVFEGYGDAEGMEQVDLWACVPSCPVRQIERDSKNSSRYFPAFYTPKPSRAEKEAGLDDLDYATLNRVNPGGLENEERWKPVKVKNNHNTVKSIPLCRWLARLVCPPGGTILDPFLGSGSVGCAAGMEGFRFLGIEQGDPPGDLRYCEIARRRMEYWAKEFGRE